LGVTRVAIVRRFTLLALVGLALTIAPGARAGAPLPNFSTIDPRLVQCPAGDIAFHVVPRRGYLPVPNSLLVVDFCGASGWVFEQAGQPAAVLFPGQACQPSVYADASGLATFALKAGGTTADSTVVLYVDGVFFGHRALGSPDQNGDLLVNAADEAILLSKLGTADLSADFDGDGVVTEADHTIQRAHLGHTSEQPTAAAASSWGRIKLSYR
jgi:hypothetical protein